MRIFGFLDQKRSKTIQILSQNFDCYGVIKKSAGKTAGVPTPPELATDPSVEQHAVLQLYDPIAVKILVGLFGILGIRIDTDQFFLLRLHVANAARVGEKNDFKLGQTAARQYLYDPIAVKIWRQNQIFFGLFWSKNPKFRIKIMFEKIEKMNKLY